MISETERGEQAPPSAGSGGDVSPPLETVCGRFTLGELLGSSRATTVYAAEDLDGTRAVVKLFELPSATPWEGRELFERSVKVLKGLDMPGLSRLHAFEEDTANSRLILVRERFDGGTLGERIRGGAALDAETFEALFIKTLELLDSLHTLALPILHRDIKPSNIMFRSDSDWEPVLVDFDTIAAPVEEYAGPAIIGTAGYAAPEQFEGRVSAASDLYSFGVTMLFAATRISPDKLPRRHKRFDVEELLESLNDTTQRVLLKLVEPNIAERFQSASAAISAFSEEPIMTEPVNTEHSTEEEAEVAPVEYTPEAVFVYQGEQDMTGVVGFGKVFAGMMILATVIFIGIFIRFKIESQPGLDLYEKENAAASAPADTKTPAKPAEQGAAPQ